MASKSLDTTGDVFDIDIQVSFATPPILHLLPKKNILAFTRWHFAAAKLAATLMTDIHM
jgi:hypothetical protein